MCDNSFISLGFVIFNKLTDIARTAHAHTRHMNE